MDGARFEVPVRGVLVLDADERGLGVWTDFCRGRFLTGDSPLTPRASKMSTSGFPSEGTKMLDECVSRTDIPRTGKGARQTDTPATITKARFKAFLALSLAFLYVPCERGSLHCSSSQRQPKRGRALQIECNHVMAPQMRSRVIPSSVISPDFSVSHRHTVARPSDKSPSA